MKNADGGLRLHPDVYVASVLLAFCGLVYWNTTTFREVPAMLSQNVPPTFFPRLIVTVMAVLSAVLLASALRRARPDRERIVPVVWLTGVTIIGVVALVSRLGMLAAVALAAVALPVCWGERRIVRLVLLAVALPVSIYLIFGLGLGMRFPPGPFR